MLNIVQDFVVNNLHFRTEYPLEPKFIVVHNTANDATAKNERDNLNRIDNYQYVSFHYAIDNNEIRQCMREDQNCWHSSDGGNGNGNRNGLAIEICYSKSGDERFRQAEILASKFIAFKLKEKGWGVDKVKKHQDFSNKNCPHRTIEWGWNRFLDMIQNELNILNEPQEEVQTPQEPTSFSVGDKVKVVGSHYATGEKVADFVYKNYYEIIQISNSGDKALLSSIMSWVYFHDLSKSSSSANVSFTNYLVLINVDSLTVRTGSGNNTGIATTVKRNEVYTIVEEKNGFGRLKSGAGWIELQYTERFKR